MSGSVLAPGAIVQHEDGRIGHFAGMRSAIVDGVIEEVAFVLGLTYGDDFGMMPAGNSSRYELLSDGWSLVGESGVRPEGAHLAWVTPEIEDHLRAMGRFQHDSFDGVGVVSAGREFVRLNPEAHDTP